MKGIYVIFNLLSIKIGSHNFNRQTQNGYFTDRTGSTRPLTLLDW